MMAYAPWWRRAAAAVIDLLPLLVLTAAGAALVWFTRDRLCDTDTSAFDGGAQCGDGYSTLGYVSLVATWADAPAPASARPPCASGSSVKPQGRQ